MVSAIHQLIKNKNELESKRIYIEETKAHNEFITNSFSIYQIIDDLIAAYLAEDRIFNSSGDINYITDKEKDRIVKDVSVKILTEMSPILYNQLSCYFNKDNIDDIITRRVIISVVGLVQKTNVSSVNLNLDEDIESYNNKLKDLVNRDLNGI